MFNVEPSCRMTILVSIADSKGDKNRMNVISLLEHTTLNTSTIAEILSLDYKVVEHHVDVLEKIIYSVV